MKRLKSFVNEAADTKPPFEGGKKVTEPNKDRFGNTVKTKNMAKHLAKRGLASVKKEDMDAEQIDEISAQTAKSAWLKRKDRGAQKYKAGDTAGAAKEFGKARANKERMGYREEQVTEGGLWANIHAKRERIKNGSGEKMRKPGSKGAPTAQDFKDAQEGYAAGSGNVGPAAQKSTTDMFKKINQMAADIKKKNVKKEDIEQVDEAHSMFIVTMPDGGKAGVKARNSQEAHRKLAKRRGVDHRTMQVKSVVREDIEQVKEGTYRADIEGLPAVFIDAKAPGEVRAQLRKLLKRPDSIGGIERVTDAEVKKHFRLKASGKEEVSESAQNRFAARLKAKGLGFDKTKKAADDYVALVNKQRAARGEEPVKK